jgi:hypothetical protein
MKTVLLMVLGISGAAGCGNSPSAPSPGPDGTGGLVELTPTGPLAIAAIEPGIGTTGGGATVKITGTGFLRDTTVTFGGQRGDAFVPLSTTLYVITPVHEAATVDVVVTGSNGEAATLTRAFTYASPQSFNFNGTWEGYAEAQPPSAGRLIALHSEKEMGFTVEDNVLTHFTCGGSANQALAPLPSVGNGEFSLVANGVSISGRIVSADNAIGMINTAACPAMRWFAGKR